MSDYIRLEDDLKGIMKTDIHPKYYTATVTCSCGNSFQIGATVESMRVELCSHCHPFYTGDQKLVDTAGRVEKFQQRLSKVRKSEKREVKSEKTEQPESNQERLKALKKKLIQA